MNHHSLLPNYLLFPLLPMACIGLLVACGTGGNENPPNAADTGTARGSLAAAHTMDCEGALDMTFRHKHYTAKELDAAEEQFRNHFKVAVGGKNEDVQDTVIRIPWRSIEELQRRLGTPERTVQGMWISFGLDGNRFHPIFRFMDQPDQKDLQLIPDSSYSYDPGSQQLVAESDPDRYMEAYLRDIRVNRVDTGFSALRTTDEADPLATWFPYADNVNELLRENPYEDQMLVVSCISEQLCYRAIAFAPAPEFRHLITLHIGDGANDHLSNSFDANKPFADMAMDLGNMCPPTCKQR